MLVRNQARMKDFAFHLAIAVFRSSELSISCHTRATTAFQKTRSSGQTKIVYPVKFNI